MEEVHRQFEGFLGQKALKLTHERCLILEHIRQHKPGHFDAEQIYTDLKERKQRISRDTVFRTLPLLLEAGLIQKSVGRGKGDYYEFLDPSSGHHDHMVCLSCGKVIEFFSERLERLQEEVCSKQGFQLAHHDHRLFGYCRECQ